MLDRHEYPSGVPCWVDLVQPDLDRTMDFYRELFGWSFEIRTPPAAPSRYAYATLDGQTVAGVGEAPASTGSSQAPAESAPEGWTTYVCVESADDAATAIGAHGGKVLSPPVDIPRAGRVALCADSQGARIGLWQPSENRGAQRVNAPGSWVFSDLQAADPDEAARFYAAVFGWESQELAFAPGITTWLWRRPGYGEFLAARDPELRERHETDEVPDGFADAVAWLQPATDAGPARGDAWWNITFGVADADAAFERAIGLGATVVTPLYDTDYTRVSTVRDPQGAELALSEYRPPAS